MEMMCNFLPGDPRLVEQIVKELKSQGIFDRFRKECIADVDTKPAYQNLSQRVDSSVSSFLKEQTWTPDMNKNQVRENLRKHVNDLAFLETGVERIVDQVVNPKINSIFMPAIEEVLYKYLGVERPKVNTFNDENFAHVSTPTDYESSSHEIVAKNIKKEETEIKSEDTSNCQVIKDKIMPEENSVDSQSSVISGIVSHDSKDSIKQDSLMSLNSSESRMSISENTIKSELDDVCISQKSSDSNSKTDIMSDEKLITENKDRIMNDTEINSEKNSEETKSKSRDKKKDKHHSSSDRSKSRSDRDKEKSRSDRDKKDDKDGKAEEKKYKIPKLSDKNKDSKTKDKEDKHKSDKGKGEKERDKKYDKDRKSKHSSEKESSSSDRNKKDKSEKREDDKRDKRDSSKSDKNKDDKRSSSSSSSSSKKKDSSSSKDKDKSSKDDSYDKNKNGHSSSSKRDSKSRKDDDKSKSSHKKEHKDEKKERQRKRKSRDDHNSSKEKRSGGRSSDRDSDGPSSSKKPYVSPENTNGNYSTQQTSQDSSGLNSDNSSGCSGTYDKAEDNNEICNVLMKLQKIKVPKFASNMSEAKKFCKIQKLIKTIKADPNNPEALSLMKELEELTKDVKKEKKREEAQEISEKENIKTEKTEPININDCILSKMSKEKYEQMEAKLKQQVDYNSYGNPDEEESFGKSIVQNTYETKEELVESEVVLDDLQAEVAKEDSSIENLNEICTDSQDKSLIHDVNYEVCTTEENFNDNDAKSNFVPETTLDLTTIGQSPNESVVVESLQVESPEVIEDSKQKPIVVLQKQDLTEEMLKIKNKENLGEQNTDNSSAKTEMALNVLDIEVGNDENISKENFPLFESNIKRNQEIPITKEHIENNLIVDESMSQDMDIYSLQNSYDLYFDEEGDLCNGFEGSHDLKSLTIIKCIINILEDDILKTEEMTIQYFSTQKENYNFQTRKRKVIEKKTDISNNNRENSASKRLEVEDLAENQKNISPTRKSTISVPTTKLSHMNENDNLAEVNENDRTSKIKDRGQSSVSNSTPVRSADGSSDKKNKSNQRYSSEDLYKPRIPLRRTGRQLKNP